MAKPFNKTMEQYSLEKATNEADKIRDKAETSKEKRVIENGEEKGNPTKEDYAKGESALKMEKANMSIQSVEASLDKLGAGLEILSPNDVEQIVANNSDGDNDLADNLRFLIQNRMKKTEREKALEIPNEQREGLISSIRMLMSELSAQESSPKKMSPLFQLEADQALGKTKNGLETVFSQSKIDNQNLGSSLRALATIFEGTINKPRPGYMEDSESLIRIHKSLARMSDEIESMGKIFSKFEENRPEDRNLSGPANSLLENLATWKRTLRSRISALEEYSR